MSQGIWGTGIGLPASKEMNALGYFRKKGVNMKLFFSTILIAGMMFVFGTAANAQGKKIGMKRAQAIASEQARGLKLRAKELEHEKGQWIYSFEFRNKDGSTREVNVNAYTGKVIGVERETPATEKKEARDEKKKPQ